MTRMKNIYLLSAALITVGILACSDHKNPEITDDAGKPPRIRMEDTISDAALAEKNRNLKQISFTQLLQYVPADNIEGFTVKDTINGENGSIGKTGARYFSFLSKTFTRNDEKVRIEIIDYTPDTAQYHGLLNMYGFNTDIDDNVQKTKKIDLNIPGTKAIATEYKTEKSSQVIVGAADRVLVIITGIQVNDVSLLEKFTRKVDFRSMIEDIRKMA